MKDTVCPTCGAQFDNWGYKTCGYALPDKYRRMIGKIVTREEMDEEFADEDE